MSADPHNLDQLQRWMLAAITHPFGTEAGLASDAARQAIDVAPDDVEQVVARSRALSSVERLDVYANAYYARLLECLRAEFPVLSRTVGESAFDQFSLGYLQRYPSRSYTLGRLGASFAQHLAETRPEGDGSAEGPGWPELLVDLARLEWAVNEVFDGPGSEKLRPVTAAQLAAVGPQRWPRARLQGAPCLRLMEFRFPVSGYFSAVRRGQTPAPPQAAPSWLALTRREYIVRRHDLTRAQFLVLGALLDGRTVEEAVAEGAPQAEGEMERYASDLRAWFADWAAEGFFVGIDAGGP
jgi:hypothetical protein